MLIGPFLKRELQISTHRGSLFGERRYGVIWSALAIGGCMGVWHWWGWDYRSVSGARWFALAAFAATLITGFVFMVSQVPGVGAPAVAGERDRKSLDSLLATPFSSAEIVLGLVGAVMMRYLNVLLAMAPIFVLIVFLGGVDYRLVLLAVAALISTAFALASLAVFLSIGSRTAAIAAASTIFWMLVWICLPIYLALVLPRIWSAIGPWIAPPALLLAQSSPIGILMNVLGIVATGTVTDSVGRMIVLQAILAFSLITWAIIRLRSISRKLHDQTVRVSRGVLPRSWRRSRPACGDDPALWRELHQWRSRSRIHFLLDSIFTLIWCALLLIGISWFALPAFAEVLHFGYGPAPAGAEFPTLNPFVRAFVAAFKGWQIAIAPGMARQEFNLVARQLTGFLIYLYLLRVVGQAAESVATERLRDTWLGLIATPLTGHEILRAKMIGAIWRSREISYALLGLWTIALVAGAVHPLGFIAAIIGLAVTSWFAAAIGVYASLWSRDLATAYNQTITPMILLQTLGALPLVWPGFASVLIATLGAPFQIAISLLSHDDAHSLSHHAVPKAFSTIGLSTWSDLQITILCWTISLIIQAAVAWHCTTTSIRGFDAAVGRPVRSAQPPAYSQGKPELVATR